MKRFVFIFLNVCLPLAVGALVYWAFRPDTVVGKWLAALFGACPFRTEEIGGSLIEALIQNHLSDFLWAYSFTALQSVFLSRIRSVLAVAAGFTFLTELAQRFPGIPGVFDWLDIAAEWCAVILAGAAVLVNRKLIRQKTIEKEKLYEEQNDPMALFTSELRGFPGNGRRQ